MKMYSRYRTTLLVAITTLGGLCLCFWWWQNNYGKIGGQIALVKSLWLATALTHFFLIPAWLWRDEQLSPRTRKFYGFFLGGFVLRALIEMPLLLLTHSWRCGHGIFHDVLMLAVLAFAWKLRDRIGRLFALLLVVVLLCEGWNAWMFGQLGSPETGIYFADDSARFAFVNRVTAAELILCGSLLVVWLRSYLKGGSACNYTTK